MIAIAVFGFAQITLPALAQNSTIPEDMGAPIVQGMCGGCHSLSGEIAGMEGPPLKGIVGRRSAAIEGFDYSDALRKLGIVWTPDNLKAFLTNPTKFAPGTKKIIALKNEDRLDEVIAYLARIQSTH
ncbi:MAG: c-type cytochrome [Rhodobacteraceae bacterium]|nr:c-type cytochrome [Paracoccaceae bacterium]